MQQEIKRLELAGEWDELNRLAETLPSGDSLARVYIALSKLAEDRATTGAEYRQALGFAQKAAAAADQGGLMWTWAQGRTAALSADLGMYPAAERAACAFLDALPGNPKAEALAPYARYALGRVRANQRRFLDAVAFYQEAKCATGSTFAERIQLAIVWAYAQAGQVVKAVEECPARVEPAHQGLLHAATAIILAKAGDWQSARTAAKAALPYYTGPHYMPCDLVEAAELCLILKAAAHHLGDTQQAAVWSHIAFNLFGGNGDVLTCLLPMLPMEGGVRFAEAASPARGLPSGHHRCGLRGVCG